MSFISNDVVEILQEAEGDETLIVLKDDKVDMVLPITCEAKQIVLEYLEIIDMVMPICIEDKKVLLEEHLAQTEKLNEKHI